MSFQTIEKAFGHLRAGVVFLFFGLSPAVADDVYEFGVVPQFEARRLSEVWAPVLEEVEARSGVKLKMVGSPRIPEFEQAFSRGDFDFTYMNPYHSLVAFQTQGYEPLVRDGARQLFGVLVVDRNANYEQVSDLAGKKIAFPSPNALGASLLMRADLTRRHGLEFVPEYVNTHSSAYLNVLLGEADAAGGVMATFNALDPDIRNRLQIIYETTRMPPHPIVVHPRVPADVARKVQKAFLEMSGTPEGREMLSHIPILEAVPAQAADYRALSDLGLEDFYVATGVN